MRRTGTPPAWPDWFSSADAVRPWDAPFGDRDNCYRKVGFSTSIPRLWSAT
nr:hypothetical protein GCM10010200_005570 [Actinomadura rugatobispora]